MVTELRVPLLFTPLKLYFQDGGGEGGQEKVKRPIPKHRKSEMTSIA